VSSDLKEICRPKFYRSLAHLRAGVRELTHRKKKTMQKEEG